ncbi:MAG TPA: LacI family DNA-binding transcriptional regulator [Anaerolineae bacterium]|nr:LacI family DNA-binding transcriptional regulator [Anaerolineae bacterium]
MNRRTITIRDVAEQAGVSQSTVSRVLNSTDTQIPISQETRLRVQRVAEELGYRPHPSARSLSGSGTGLIGVITREINDPFFAELIDVISNVAKEEGYDLVLGNAKREPENALALRDRMLDPRYCDGLLLCGDLRESPEDHTFLDKMGRDHRLVSVSRGSQHLVRSTPSVDIDNRKGVILALDYLAQLGHQRIACMNVGRVGDLWERLEAYREFMQDRFGRVPEEYIQSTKNSYKGGYEATRALLSLSTPPTALFAGDDMMALGAMGAAIDMGWAVPADLSIVGFDDMEVAAYVRPALTTVRQPMEELGRKAVELLLTMLEDEGPCNPTPRLVLEPELIIRDSCGPPTY